MSAVAVRGLDNSCTGVCSICGATAPGKITTSGSTVGAFSKQVSVETDVVTSSCPCASTGVIDGGLSSKMSIRSKKVAKVGSTFSGNYTGSVIAGQPKFTVP